MARRSYTQSEVEEIFKKEGFSLKSQYVNIKTKMQVLCPKKHEFFPTLGNFLNRKSRCPVCAKKIKYTQEQVDIFFKEKGYTVKGKYINVDSKIKVICPINHEWEVRLGDFSRGIRCPSCAGLKRKTQEEAETIFDAEGYTLKSKYVNAHGILSVICSRDHEITTTIHSFLNHKSRCCICGNTGTSKPEQELLNILKKTYPNLVKKNFSIKIPDKPHIHRFQVDIYNSNRKVGIEFDGKYHHSEKFLIKSKTKYGWPVEDAIKYHEIKDAILWDFYGVKILHIKEQDWNKDKQACIDKCLQFLNNS